jgi:DHA2 family lincomycin resistance protein-like MFS transporter
MFTPMFTMSLGSLSSHLYSHGSSLLGATQQVAGALGTAVAVVVLTSQASAAAAQGAGATAAYLTGLHWAFGLCAAAAVAMVGLVATLPARVEANESETEPVHV